MPQASTHSESKARQKLCQILSSPTTNKQNKRPLCQRRMRPFLSLARRTGSKATFLPLSVSRKAPVVIAFPTNKSPTRLFRTSVPRLTGEESNKNSPSAKHGPGAEQSQSSKYLTVVLGACLGYLLWSRIWTLVQAAREESRQTAMVREQE